jgi:hypothetical protein
VGQPASGLTGTTSFHHNIVIFNSTNAGAAIIGGSSQGNQYGFETPVLVYNNTLVITAGGIPSAAWLTGTDAGAIEYYNNIYVNNSASGGDNLGYGAFSTNPSAPGVWDYNLAYSPSVTLQWRLWTNGGFTTQVSGSPYTSAASFASALSSNGGISGAETHSVIGTAPTFTNTGSYASKYQLASGSAGIGQGSTDGTTGGSACDMGAWGGASVPTKIGCDF